MKTQLYTILLALFVVSCGKGKFTVSGEITNAKDSILYFENISLDGPVVLDSIVLNEEGKFAFAENATEAPEFYRLRIAGQIINIVADSTETITISAKYPQMAVEYKVEGSEECKTIQELAYKQISIQQQAINIQQNPSLSYEQSADSIMSIINAYKEDVKKNYIYKNPARSSSYFALFQAIGNTLIFNPRENEEDIKVFGAVATQWDEYHQGALRTENLHNITIEGMKNIRIVRNRQAKSNMQLASADVSNIIDIKLEDNKGKMRSIKDLKGKVVMLDFHIFGSKESTQRIMQMRELYNKYHTAGLEIFQISLDADAHFWKINTAALPWISVFDPNGVESVNVRNYNVNTIPTFFLIDKSNQLYKRDVQIKDIDAEIKKLL